MLDLQTKNSTQMKNIFKTILVLTALVMILSACKKQDYSLGDLTAPTNIVITTEILGVDAIHPNGDGSGLVKIIVTADNAISCKAGVSPATLDDFKVMPLGNKVTRKFATSGVNTYRMVFIVSGKGGTTATATADIIVRSDFTPAPSIVTNLTANASKTWVVDKSIPAHFGVGPYNVASIRPEWWAGAVNEKLTCCPCFYDARFTFTKVNATDYSLTVATSSAFTKTGILAGGLPGIPASGDEGCYAYPGGTSAFSFIEASSGAPVTPSVPANSTTTQTSILLDGNLTYIGYGALLKEYEILEITPTSMYLRVQGTETANAWYLKLKSI